MSSFFLSVFVVIIKQYNSKQLTLLPLRNPFLQLSDNILALNFSNGMFLKKC